MQYTSGNWSVKDLITDSVTTTKNVAVPSITWSDYAKSVDEPEVALVTNITGAAITSPETVRFAAQNVANIYKDTKVDITQQTPAKTGRRCMAEIAFQLQATNSVSGQELILPFKGRIVLELPSVSFVTPVAIEYALKRTLAAGFDSGASVTADRFTEMARGSLLPD